MVHVPVFRGRPEAQVLDSVGGGLQGCTSVLERGSANNSAWKPLTFINLLTEHIPDKMKTSAAFLLVLFLERARWNPTSLQDGVQPPHPTTSHCGPEQLLAASTTFPRAPWSCHRSLDMLSALGQTPGNNLLEEGKKDPRAGDKQGRHQAVQGTLSWDVAPALPPGFLTLRLLLWCWRFSINAAMGQSKILLWSHSLPCSGKLCQICTSGWRWTLSKAAISQLSNSPYPKSPSCVSRVKNTWTKYVY